MDDRIRANSDVLFYYNRTKRWLARVSRGGNLHTHVGVIPHDGAIGKEYGSRLVTNKDKYVYLLRPTSYDYTMKIEHGTQIVYPKDLGYIVARAGHTGRPQGGGDRPPAAGPLRRSLRGS